MKCNFIFIHMSNNVIDRGTVVEKIVRRSGYSLSKLAAKLGVSRNTLYNKFKNANVSYRFIMEVGNILHYDFTLDFPEMKESVELKSENHASKDEEELAAILWRLESKYNNLLEKHNKLLEMVLRVVDRNELHELGQEIAKILEK